MRRASTPDASTSGSNCPFQICDRNIGVETSSAPTLGLVTLPLRTGRRGSFADAKGSALPMMLFVPLTMSKLSETVMRATEFATDQRPLVPLPADEKSIVY